MLKVAQYTPAPGVVPVVVFDPILESVRAVCEKLTDRPNVKAIHCETVNEAASFTRSLDAVIVIACIESSDQLVKQLTFMKMMSEPIRSKRMRLVVVTKVQNETVLDKLQAYGASEILNGNVTEKVLSHKLDRHIQASSALLRNVERQKENQKQANTNDEATKKNKKNTRAARPKVSVKRVAPLSLKSDCFAIGQGTAQRSGTRWVMTLRGPSPDLGRWAVVDRSAKELKGEFFDSVREKRDELWVWTPTTEGEDYLVDAGSWYFLGSRPQYRSPTWTFFGAEPLLAFVNEGVALGYRVKATSAFELEISTDSSQSQNMLTRAEEIKRQHDLMRQQERLEKENARRKQSQGAGGSGLGDDDLGESGEAPWEAVSALQIESDCFLLQGRRPRRVAGRWMVPVLAPSPAAGRWEKLETSTQTTEDTELWHWIPAPQKGGKDPFIHEDGEWVFRGLAPRFQESVWLFVGREPSLRFCKKGAPQEAIAERISFSENKLRISEDSLAGQRSLPQILASYDQHIEGMEAEGGETGTIKGRRPPDAVGDSEAERAFKDEFEGEANRVFRMPASTFGDPPGRWQYVTADASGGRWYAYLPPNLPDPEGVDPESLSPYWIFHGVKRPELKPSKISGSFDWEFEGYDPRAIELFSELLSPIQSFYREVCQKADLSIALDRASESELNDKRENANGAPKDAHDITQEALEARELNDKRQAEAPEPSDAQPNLEEVALPEPESHQERRDSQPIAESKPLRPLALAFLLSELMWKRELTPELRATRFAEYVESSLGGIRVEIWNATPEGPKCLSHSSPHYQATSEYWLKNAAVGEHSDSAHKVWVAPIWLNKNAKGAIVLGIKQSKKDKVAAPDPKYLDALGELAQKLVA